MRRLGKGLGLSILASLGLLLAGNSYAARQPNIVLMLSDNLGFGDIGVYGGGELRGAPTPTLDALAKEGMRFSNFNVEAECTPSRSALMTGRLAIRSGNSRAIPVPGLPVGLAPYEISLATMLKQAGYNTAIFGKWHIGYAEDRLPTAHGFDQWWGFPFSTDVSWFPDAVGFDPALFPTPRMMEGRAGGDIKLLQPYDKKLRPFVDEMIAQKSVDYIAAQAKSDKPFFLYIPWSLVHHPSIPHPDFVGKSSAGKYGDATVEHDHRVGQVLAAIEAAGIADNTLVIYASDNGPDRAEYPYVGDTGPYRGYLGTVHEGSIRTPMMMRWPGKIAPRVSNEIVSIHDIYPTLANLAGGEVPDDRAIDGVDQSDFILGKQDKSARESILFFTGDTPTAVKWRQFKIYLSGESAERSARNQDQLWAPRAFNLEQDRKEENDIALQNLWLLAPGLKPLFEYVYSVEKYGLILPGGDKPSLYQAPNVPFYTPEALSLTMKSIKNEAVKKMLKQKLDQLMGKE